MISEAKIHETFPVGNFVIDGYSTPYRLDRNSNVVESIIYNLIIFLLKNEIFLLFITIKGCDGFIKYASKP